MVKMGYIAEFNWYIVDKQNNLKEITEGQELTITKSGERIYPLNLPLLLLDADWNVYGYAAVQSAERSSNQTIVRYKVLKILSNQEKEVFTRVIKEIHKK